MIVCGASVFFFQLFPLIVSVANVCRQLRIQYMYVGLMPLFCCATCIKEQQYVVEYQQIQPFIYNVDSSLFAIVFQALNLNFALTSSVRTIHTADLDYTIVMQ
jgi:hypothetical protein